MSEKKKWENIRHRVIYKTARVFLPLLLKKYGFSTNTLPKTEGNYIVISNHLTEVDMLMVALAFPEHMYFVAGEHLLRSKYGKLIKWSQDPIFEAKGAPSMRTVIEIVRRAKAGSNIMIFPEGSRSFNGETIEQPETIAKLVKRCGCGLVTYHISGGYFVAPRWAYHFRVGPMKGEIVTVRSADEISKMSNQELADAINNEIYENAYKTQRKARFSYQGENLAEGIENYLIKCTECGSFDSLASNGNDFHCSVCGLSGTYTEQGFLVGEKLKFDSVYDWGKWAENETTCYIETWDDSQICFADNTISLFTITENHKKKELYSGDIIGYKDRMIVGEYTFAYKDISAMSMLYYGKTLLFTCSNGYFGITGEKFHAIKYQKLYEHYRNGRKKDES